MCMMLKKMQPIAPHSALLFVLGCALVCPLSHHLSLSQTPSLPHDLCWLTRDVRINALKEPVVPLHARGGAGVC